MGLERSEVLLALQTLIKLGFDRDKALKALLQTRCDLSEACRLLSSEVRDHYSTFLQSSLSFLDVDLHSVVCVAFCTPS